MHKISIRYTVGRFDIDFQLGGLGRTGQPRQYPKQARSEAHGTELPSRQSAGALDEIIHIVK
jgi:hypothetical protein